MSAGPAAIYGLERPRIAVGAPANLVLLDLEAAWRPDERSFRSKSANSWLLGQELTGRVEADDGRRPDGVRGMRSPRKMLRIFRGVGVAGASTTA